MDGRCRAEQVISPDCSMIQMFQMDRPAVRVNMMAPYGVGGFAPHVLGGNTYERVQDKAAGSCRQRCRVGPGSDDMTRIGRLGRMIRLGRIAGVVRGLGDRIQRLRAGQGSAEKDAQKEPLRKAFMTVIQKTSGIVSLGMFFAGLCFAILGYHLVKPEQALSLALSLAGVLSAPGLVMLLMLLSTHTEVVGLKVKLDGISKQQLPKSEMAEMAENIKGMRAEMLPKKDMVEMAENIKGMRAEMLPKKDMAEMAENIKGMRAEMLPKKDMAEMAENIKGMRAEMKTESEKTGKVLGSIAGTLEGMNKTLKSIDGKLDGNPGPSVPKRPDQ
ncbi:hypothetical protein CENSYa_0727 [Cenarchaeum symbiosum A]|uniref:Uncharacterized protein n=1 Tax=Cenarchaeum symbiosum (strain A) TaxID=414004 RepID=A0RVJ3_CENSY|nr:hypothetical protein CENSYa_0727 [Cenarchaeum symbiosum A]